MDEAKKPSFYFNTAGWQYSVPSGDAAHAPPLDPFQFHTKKLPDYQETKLIQLGSESLASLDPSNSLDNIRPFVKDESTRCGLPAFKILGASFAIFCTLCERHGLDPSTASLEDLVQAEGRIKAQEKSTRLYAATDGNHGRAVARMGSILGLETRIFVPNTVEQYSIDMIGSEIGCEVQRMDDLDYDQTVEHCADVCNQDAHRGLLIQDTAWEGYERIPTWIVSGYRTLFAEVDKALESTANRFAPTHVFVPAGVGSLAHGATLHYRHAARAAETRPRLITVEPTVAACVLTSLQKGQMTSITTSNTIMPGLNCGTVSHTAWPDLRGGIDAAVQVNDEEVRTIVETLAPEKERTGLDVGPCGAASLAGLLQCCRNDRLKHDLGLGPDSVVVLISSEGAQTFLGQQQQQQQQQ